MNSRRRNDNTLYIFFLVIWVFVVWVALKIAPFGDAGLMGILEKSDYIFNDIGITYCDNSLKYVFFLSLMYLAAIGIYISTRKNTRPEGAYGSAKWGSARAIEKKYADRKNYENNKILTQNVRISLNTRKHKRNKNTCIVGGSGAGKSRFAAKPNLYQANTSFIVLDTKGELLRASGNLLKSRGYKIKCLNLLDMDKSDSFNPFAYIRGDIDIQKIATNFFKATHSKDAAKGEQFWEDMAQLLFKCVMSYLYYEAPEYEQNFHMIMWLANKWKPREDDENYKSTFDLIFDELAEKKPDHIAVTYYEQLKGPGRTVKSILSVFNSHMEKFAIDEFARICKTDELELAKLGEEKTALFLVIPSNDTSFNFWVSMVYQQAFQALMKLADEKYDGTLPVEVHLLMDEFANVQVPEDFDKIIAVIRSYNISVTIMLQAISQLSNIFKDGLHKVIIANCDTFLYLGGNEEDSYKYVSSSLGKETIDITTTSQSKGSHGSFSKNFQQQGRELLTEDEVRLIPFEDCVLFIRGERPVYDRKYDITRHPNVALTPDGGGPRYYHSKRRLEYEDFTVTSVMDAVYYDDLADEAVEWLSDSEVSDIIKGYEQARVYSHEDIENKLNYYNSNEKKEKQKWKKTQLMKWREHQEQIQREELQKHVDRIRRKNGVKRRNG